MQLLGGGGGGWRGWGADSTSLARCHDQRTKMVLQDLCQSPTKQKLYGV